MSKLTLADLGWQAHFEQQVTVEETDACLKARVVSHQGSQVRLVGTDGELVCPTSLLEDPQEDHTGIAVGDWYLLNPSSFRRIRRLERKTSLSRRAAGLESRLQCIAANVDTVWIVSSCNQDFNLSRLERYLALVADSGCQAIVVLTKSDLSADPYELRRQAEKIHPGLIVEILDARDPLQVSVLLPWCASGKTVALLGSSGVGKSTLVNSLGGFGLTTNGIRQADDKGRHTTTTRSLNLLSTGGWLLDTPGMRELQITDCEEAVEQIFDDIVELANACQFRNCQHQQEPGCKIQQAIDSGELDPRRLVNFRKLLNEQARNAESVAQRREKNRKQGAFYKRVISEKKNRRELR